MAQSFDAQCAKDCQLRAKPRARRCLLKGCESWFKPKCALCRYCSAECKDAARAWSVFRARRRYRRSAQGGNKRRIQSHRYRERQKERERCGSTEQTELCEGDQKKGNSFFICARPGCYENAAPTRRSPLKKFCSISCYKCLRQVNWRESRWRRLLGFDSYACCKCIL